MYNCTSLIRYSQAKTTRAIPDWHPEGIEDGEEDGEAEGAGGGEDIVNPSSKTKSPLTGKIYQ